ncbi:MAG TPA: HAMP domain-containing sensor histidine kinase [Kineosporiaceae bacterium]|nr:HAMP domain-containing sensor histidine kinase [Kineosporiaceae bacterium]
MRSLAARVVTLVAAVALGSAAVTTAVLVRAITQGNRDRAAAVVALEADNLADRVSAGRPVGLQTVLARIAVRGDVASVAGPGRVSLPVPFTTGDLATGPGAPDVQQRSVGGRDWLVAARGTSIGQVALVARPLGRAATGLTAAQRRQVALGALGVVGVGVVGGLLLAQGVARPLRRVAAAARRLSAGDREVRVEVDGPAEVADVAGALDHLAGRLAETEDRQRRFLLAVSHELRTPLTAVAGYGEALADGVLPTAEVPHAGAVIRAEAGRLQRRVEDLMALARLQADDFRVEPGSVDVVAVVDAAAAAWRPRAGAAGVDLRVERPVGAVPAWADGERLRQALDALVDNALRVLPAGAPLVLAGGTGRSGGAWVQVRDGGPGLDADDLAHAFEPGRLTERYRGSRAVGSGLGLALVAALARRMGGRAVAGVAPEGGAAFTLELPPAPRSPR